LELIKEKKHILFGQFTTTLDNGEKQKAWEEVREKAMSLGIISANRDRNWVRDRMFGVWRDRSMVIILNLT
jgi:hypothetical protein